MIISYHIFQSLQSQTVSMLAALAAKAKVANFHDSHLFLDVQWLDKDLCHSNGLGQ